MDIFNPLNKNQFPADAETWAFLQNIIKQVSHLALLGGENYILTGCEKSGANISDGWVVVDGEIMPFVGGTYMETFIIDETSDPVNYEGINYPDLYVNRFARFGTSSKVYYFSAFKRFKGFAAEKHTHKTAEITDFKANLKAPAWTYVQKHELANDTYKHANFNKEDAGMLFLQYIRYRVSPTGLVSLQGFITSDKPLTIDNWLVWTLPPEITPKHISGLVKTILDSDTGAYKTQISIIGSSLLCITNDNLKANVSFNFNYYID